MFDKQKRRKQLSCHFGDDNVLINGYILNAVHYVPAKIEQGLELDFYMDIGDDIYLLRLQNNPENLIIFVDREIVTTKVIPVTYIIVRKILSDDIDQDLDLIVRKLKGINFPNHKGEKRYEIEKWD